MCAPCKMLAVTVAAVPQIFSSTGIQDAIGDAGDACHFGYVMDADDVCAVQDAGGDGGGGAPDFCFCCDSGGSRGWSGLGVLGERFGDEAFA